MTERIVQFGPDALLHGVLRGAVARHDTAMLLFNAGVIHRIGPHRLNVKIARAIDCPSLRFDLSGQGESPSAPPGLGFEAQAAADISAAVDLLKDETGAGAVIAIGLCSGADHAVKAAVADPRINGLVLLDPYAYPNSAAARADFCARAADPDRWSRKLRALVARDEPEANTVSDPEQSDDLEQGRPLPPKEEFAGDLKTLTDRGVRILIVYTGLVRRLVSKPQHFFETFAAYDFSGCIDVVTMPHADHTFTSLAAQEELIDNIEGWRRRHFLSAAFSVAS